MELISLCYGMWVSLLFLCKLKKPYIRFTLAQQINQSGFFLKLVFLWPWGQLCDSCYWAFTRPKKNSGSGSSLCTFQRNTAIQCLRNIRVKSAAKLLACLLTSSCKRQAGNERQLSSFPSSGSSASHSPSPEFELDLVPLTWGCRGGGYSSHLKLLIPSPYDATNWASLCNEAELPTEGSAWEMGRQR